MRKSVLALLFLCVASLAAAQTDVPWSYQGQTGPAMWGRLSPAYRACSKGVEQSPVDIRRAHLDRSLKPIEFHYIAGSVTIENTGHTVEVRVNPGSYIVADGVRYDLVQIHFHHPSEHTVNGDLSDMEIHLVHRSAEGKLAVLAVLFSENADFANATLATLWAHMPTQPGQAEKVSDMVNPGGLIPRDRGYWTYTGSLTAPPCTEGVRWFVFEQAISISRSQYDAFARLYKNNSRPTQDLHGRRIQASE